MISVAPGAAAQDEAPKPYSFNSRYYAITTDVPRDLARAIAVHMDAVYREYTSRFSAFKGRRRGAEPLFIASTQAGYQQFLAGYGINGAGSGGMYFYGPKGSALATYASQSRDRMFHTLRHEGFHQFAASRIGPNLPPWANEGMAEYFGEAIMVKGRLTTGQIPPSRLARLQGVIEKKEHIPLETLMNLSPTAWGARVRAGQSGLQYDQSWALVHFLVNARPVYQRAFIEYLTAVARGVSSRDAFQRAFGTSNYDAVERAWAKYMADLAPTPVKEAAQRLEFLATGMRLLHDREGKKPESIAGLKETLQARRFATRQQVGHGVTIELKASDDALFEAPEPAQRDRRGRRVRPTRRSNDAPKMALLPAPGEDLLPGIEVTGLSLTVRLEWRVGPDGEPVSQVVYE